MSYIKQNFSDGDTLYAAQLNHIEEGVGANEAAIEEEAGRAVSAEELLNEAIAALQTATTALQSTVSALQSGKLSGADCVNVLTSTADNLPLSAAMGRQLNSKFTFAATSYAVESIAAGYIGLPITAPATTGYVWRLYAVAINATGDYTFSFSGAATQPGAQQTVRLNAGQARSTGATISAYWIGEAR